MRYIIVDGNHLSHRCYYRLSHLMARKTKLKSGLLFGFMQTIRKLTLMFAPCKMICIFDGGTEKTKIDPMYKANRVAHEDDFYSQLADLVELLKSTGMPTIRMDGYEADTLIGIVAHLCERKGDIIVVSSDKDMLQLINEKVKVFDDRIAKVWDTEAFRREYSGLYPASMVDMKAIGGDSGDNIIGIKGIGIKRASQLVEEMNFLLHLHGKVPVFEKFISSDKDKWEFVSARLKNILFNADDRERIRRNTKLVKIPNTNKEILEYGKVFLKKLKKRMDEGEKDRKKFESIINKYELLSVANWIEKENSSRRRRPDGKKVGVRKLRAA